MPADRNPEVLTVARLNREVRALLATGLPALWVEGEVSRLARPASGHVYFELKDAAARVRCVLWRSRAALYARDLAEGTQVLVRARATLYEDRGEFQLDVEHVETAGEGRLRRAFEALRARLASEGLFDAAAKRAVPHRVRRVGLVTSAAGAALHDVLTTLGRRAPWLEVVLYPTSVQGAAATAEIVRALERASARAETDVLLLVRGGGSLEDLWCFNEEAVVRAIRAVRLPVVSGVGHEVDVTLADLAADLRAPTPTAAAELVTPDAAALAQRLAAGRLRLAELTARTARQGKVRLAHLEHRLRRADPRERLVQQAQRLDGLERRLGHALERRLAESGRRLARLAERHAARAPGPRLAALRAGCVLKTTRLVHAFGRLRDRDAGRLTVAVRTLETVSPLATLARGYAIVTDETGRLVESATQVAPGDAVQARLARGRLWLAVTGKEEG